MSLEEARTQAGIREPSEPTEHRERIQGNHSSVQGRLPVSHGDCSTAAISNKTSEFSSSQTDSLTTCDHLSLLMSTRAELSQKY